MVSLDGYFEGDKPWDIDWHQVDDEFNEFAIKQLDEFDCLVFGRSTYEGMAQYWPGEEAIRTDREVASRMNRAPKIVLSRTLQKPEKGQNLLVLGSSVLTTSLMEQGLLDELRIIINPVLIGSGRPLASSATRRIPLKLLSRRDFRNGNVLLTYRPHVDAT
ncbi:MAG: hypothetical protein AUI87_02675 [Actinobacteria bacterium 13_1_40CM_3_66_19]|nr:MAG: hypothetical protein AUI87_02675 [Actinobacteria bacterium 13_1_40CM_3_66_19]